MEMSDYICFNGRSFFALYVIVHSIFDHGFCGKVLMFIVWSTLQFVWSLGESLFRH